MTQQEVNELLERPKNALAKSVSVVERVIWIATAGEERHGVYYQPSEADWARLVNQAIEALKEAKR